MNVESLLRNSRHRYAESVENRDNDISDMKRRITELEEDKELSLLFIGEIDKAAKKLGFNLKP